MLVLQLHVYKFPMLHSMRHYLIFFLTGLIVGAIIRYAGSTNQVTYIDAHPAPDTKYNLSVPPDVLRFHFPEKIQISSGG